MNIHGKSWKEFEAAMDELSLTVKAAKGSIVEYPKSKTGYEEDFTIELAWRKKGGIKSIVKDSTGQVLLTVRRMKAKTAFRSARVFISTYSAGMRAGREQLIPYLIKHNIHSNPFEKCWCDSHRKTGSCPVSGRE